MQQALAQNDHQQKSQQLMELVPEFQAIVQKQYQLLHGLTAQNLLRVNAEQQQIDLAAAMFCIRFRRAQSPCIQLQSTTLYPDVEHIRRFLLHDVMFLTGDQHAQHSLFLKTKAQLLRQSLIEQVFCWIEAESRIEAYLQAISLPQAKLLDQLMIAGGYYQQPHLQDYAIQQVPIPLAVMLNFKHMCLINSVMGESFLPVSGLIPVYEKLSRSAAQWLGKTAYRIIALLFPERFTLQQVLQQQLPIQQLHKPAIEQPALLGFVRCIQPQHWQRDDVLAKVHFLTRELGWWQPEIGNLPVLQLTRTVNWLFKQDTIVLDWVSEHLQHAHVRCAVTACSFLDTWQMHPQVILQTLKYFQYVAAGLWIQSCQQLALQQHWFEHPKNTRFVLYGQARGSEPRRLISNSVMYFEEWQQLLLLVHESAASAWKSSYQSLSRIMQAYMQHLQAIVQPLDPALIAYMDVEKQQDQHFYLLLQRLQLDVSHFRQLFYLQSEHTRVSVFEAYVRDYLADYLRAYPVVPKNLTWNGLFQQAISWHQQQQRQNILAKLQQRSPVQDWAPLTQTDKILWGEWSFEELHSIERIIQESTRFRHCLASSYSQRIIDGEYVAFHMQHRQQHEKAYTLGCHYRAGVFVFDQLELPNNRKADAAMIQIAQRFVARLNVQMQQQD